MHGLSPIHSRPLPHAVIAGVLAALYFSATSIAAAKTPLVVYHRNATAETEWFKRIAAEFEAMHPEIEIQLVSAPGGLGYSERLLLLYGSGQAPDVAFNTADKVGHIVMGLALDLTPFIERDRDQLDLDDFLPGSLEPWNFDGKQMSLPLMAVGSHLFVNVDHLEQAGLPRLPNTWETEAWTWDDLVEYGKKLRRVDSQGRVIQIAVDFGEMDTSPALTWLFGGDWFDAEAYRTGIPRRIYLNTPEAIAAYEAVLDLKFEHQIMPSPITEWGVSANVHRFIAGQMSMYAHGGYWANTVRSSSPSFRWVIAPIPKAVNRTWRTYNDPMFISSATQHPDEAWEFLKFATSRRGLELFAQIWGFPPARASAMLTWVRAISDALAMNEAEIMEQIADGMRFGRSWTDSIAYTHDIRTITTKHLLPMLDGKVSVPAALDAAEREINARLAEIATSQEAAE